MPLIDVLSRMDPQRRSAFVRFIETGEADDEFLDFVDRDASCQQALEEVFAEQEKRVDQFVRALHGPEVSNVQTASASIAQAIESIARAVQHATTLHPTERKAATKPAVKAVPDGYSTVTLIITYHNCAGAIDWYKRALGAQERSRAIGPGGEVMHAEIQVGNSRIMMHDVMMDAKGVEAFRGSPIGLWAYVEDCDTLFNRALCAGAHPQRPVADQFWGDRCGTFIDPFGIGWTIATRKEDLTEKEMNARVDQFFAQQTAQTRPPAVQSARA